MQVLCNLYNSHFCIHRDSPSRPCSYFCRSVFFLQLHASFIMNVSHYWIPYQIHKFLQSVLSLRCCLKILIFLVLSWFSLPFSIVSYIKNVSHWFLRVLSCNVISPVKLCKLFHFLFCFSPQPYLLKRFLTTRRFKYYIFLCLVYRPGPSHVGLDARVRINVLFELFVGCPLA